MRNDEGCALCTWRQDETRWFETGADQIGSGSPSPEHRPSQGCGCTLDYKRSVSDRHEKQASTWWRIHNKEMGIWSLQQRWFVCRDERGDGTFTKSDKMLWNGRSCMGPVFLSNCSLSPDSGHGVWAKSCAIHSWEFCMANGFCSRLLMSISSWQLVLSIWWKSDHEANLLAHQR